MSIQPPYYFRTIDKKECQPRARAGVRDREIISLIPAAWPRARGTDLAMTHMRNTSLAFAVAHARTDTRQTDGGHVFVLFAKCLSENPSKSPLLFH